jgi:hypothetical protein
VELFPFHWLNFGLEENQYDNFGANSRPGKRQIFPSRPDFRMTKSVYDIMFFKNQTVIIPAKRTVRFFNEPFRIFKIVPPNV